MTPEEKAEEAFVQSYKEIWPDKFNDKEGGEFLIKLFRQGTLPIVQIALEVERENMGKILTEHNDAIIKRNNAKWNQLVEQIKKDEWVVISCGRSTDYEEIVHQESSREKILELIKEARER